MQVQQVVRSARYRAGLTQRALAERAGVPQSTVGRIETGVIDPKAATIERLLRACDVEVELVDRLGLGVDRSQVRERLARTPHQRLEDLTVAAREVERLRRARPVR